MNCPTPNYETQYMFLTHKENFSSILENFNIIDFDERAVRRKIEINAQKNKQTNKNHEFYLWNEAKFDLWKEDFLFWLKNLSWE